jgi:electron transfer flavoprotein alpha subunit
MLPLRGFFFSVRPAQVRFYIAPLDASPFFWAFLFSISIYISISNLLFHFQISLFRNRFSTLAILQEKEAKFLPASLSALTAARQISPSENAITALVTGSHAQPLASLAAKFPGVKKVLAVSNPAYDKSLPENFAPLLARVIEQEEISHVVAAHDNFGKNTIPRLAAALDSQPIADIVQILSPDTFVRQIYAGINFIPF